MKAKIIILIIISGILTSYSGCGFMSKKYLKTKTEELTIKTADKKKIKISNISGDITIKQGNDSSDVFIRVKKEIKVKKKDLDTPFDEIEILVDSNGSEINIESEINSKQNSTFFKFNKGNNARVDYMITLPPGLEVILENVNGDISLSGLNNDLRLELVNGDVDLNNYSGKLECEIVNGTFSGEIMDTKGIDINTINGSVSLVLNNFINAKITAETVNGKISDEDLQIKEIERRKKYLEFIIGSENSDTKINVSTVNGRIRFKGNNEI